jgi:hypothetical protein
MRSYISGQSSVQLRMDPENINAVASLKNNTPRTIGDMPKLLGLLSYYRRYVPNFAQKARPLIKRSMTRF